MTSEMRSGISGVSLAPVTGYQKEPSDQSLSEVNMTLQELAVAGKLRAEGIDFQATVLHMEASQKLYEAEVQEQKDQIGETGTEGRRDTAELTSVEENKRAEEQKARVKVWTAEAEKAAWEELLKWMSEGTSSQGNLSQSLDRLRMIVQRLLEAILQNTSGEAQLQQLAKLDAAVFQVLAGLMKTDLDELVSFLGRYESADTVAAIRASLYRLITGKNLSSKDAAQFLEGGISRPATQMKQDDAKGVTYQHAGGTRIRIQQNSESGGGKAADGMDFAGGARLELSRGSLQKGERVTSRFFSASDMELSQAFVAQIRRDAPALSEAGQSGEKGQMLGLSAGVASLKGQVFIRNSGISAAMSQVIESAVERFVFYHILHGERDGEETIRSSMEQNVETERKQPYQEERIRVYHYMLHIYKETGNAQEAILRGIQYMRTISLQKARADRSDASEVRERDSEAGSSIALPWGELAGWEQNIKKNWNRFVLSVMPESSKKLEFDLSANSGSLWAAAMQPGTMPWGAGISSTMTAVLWGTALLLAVLCVGLTVTGRGSIPVYFFFGGGLLITLTLAVREHRTAQHRQR